VLILMFVVVFAHNCVIQAYRVFIIISPKIGKWSNDKIVPDVLFPPFVVEPLPPQDDPNTGSCT
jgi:hypothetical protein